MFLFILTSSVHFLSECFYSLFSKYLLFGTRMYMQLLSCVQYHIFKWTIRMLQVCCIPKDLTKTEPLGPSLPLTKFSNKTDLDITEQKENFKSLLYF